MRVLAEDLPDLPQKEKDVRKVRDWGLTDHAREKMQVKGVGIRALYQCIQEGRLVEYNTNKGSRRVLWRDRRGTCAVLDLDYRLVITVFRNNPQDNHPTLDRTIYNKPYGLVDRPVKLR